MLLSFVTSAKGQINNEQPVNASELNSNAKNVRILSQVGGAITSVYVDPKVNRAYIVEGPKLKILDVSDPTHPQLLGKTGILFDLIGGTNISGDGYLIYIVASQRLHIINVSDPANPIEIATYINSNIRNQMENVFVAGNIAYIQEQTGLRILNVADPTNPFQITYYDMSGYRLYDIALMNNIVLLAFGSSSGQGGIRIVDFKDPANPIDLGIIDTNNFDSRGVAVAGKTAYVISDGGFLTIVDLSVPNQPKELGQKFLGCCEPVNINVIGSIVYVVKYIGDDPDGIHILDISNPSSPVEIGYYATGFFIDSISVSHETMYIPGNLNGLKILNVSHPHEPVEIGSYSELGRAYGISEGYVADQNYGLRTFNIYDASNPITTKAYKMPERSITDDVFAIANLAYVSTGGAIHRLDIFGSEQPIEIGIYTTTSRINDIYAYYNTVFLAEDQGLHVISFENPSIPVEIGYLDTPGQSVSLSVVYTTAYIADGIGGLRIIDINDPTKLKEVGFYSTTVPAQNVYVYNKTAYLSLGYGGLYILDVTNPSNPVKIASYNIWAKKARVNGNKAFLITQNGLRVFRIDSSTVLTEIGFYEAQDFGNDLILQGNNAFVTNDDGLWVLQSPACYWLSLKHTGLGSNPVTGLNHSTDCNDGMYQFGETISLSTSPVTGWKVGSWFGTSDTSSIVNNILVMPAADHEVTVNYVPICYPLSLSHTGEGNDPETTPNNSSGCAVGQFVVNQPITFTASPDLGSRVIGWLGTSNDSLAAITNTLVMPSLDHTIKVKYDLDCYPLALSHVGLGNDPVASPTQSDGCTLGNYHRKEPITLHAAPAKDWLVMSWSGLENGVLTATVNELSMPTHAQQIIVHYGETPLAGLGDSYEQDNSCTRSHPIANDGSEFQLHTFHQPGDADWIRFDTRAGSSYRFEVTVPQTSTADVIVETYRSCEGGTLGSWDENFAPSAAINISATTNGPVFVRIINVDDTMTGENAIYRVNVSQIGSQPVNRAAIIVAGWLKDQDPVQPQIYNVAGQARSLFLQNGYREENIYLLAKDANLPGYNVPANLDNLQVAITQWAKERVRNGVLNLYLIDHGSPNHFYLDGKQQILTPDLLNQWLNSLETSLAQTGADAKINIFIESCESGSFIDGLDGSISKIGRVILTSSSDALDAYVSRDGTYFSDQLISNLRSGNNLATSFDLAKSVASSANPQQPWIDSNGNKIPNEEGDTIIAQQRGFSLPGTLPADQWPPHIFKVESITPIQENEVLLKVIVRDDVVVDSVWVEVYKPDYVEPVPNQELKRAPVTDFLLRSTGVDGQWQVTIPVVKQKGTYRLLIQARDRAGLVAVPLAFEFSTAPQQSVYLPLIAR